MCGGLGRRRGRLVVFWSRMWRRVVVVVSVCRLHHHYRNCHCCSSRHCNLQRHRHHLNCQFFSLVDYRHLSAAVLRIVLDMLKDVMWMFLMGVFLIDDALTRRRRLHYYLLRRPQAVQPSIEREMILRSWWRWCF